MLRPEGVITALVTPFKASDESIDYAALEHMIDIQCKAEVDGIFVSGSTAEAYAMEFEEKRDLLKATISYVKGRTAVYFGAGGSSTKQTVDLVQMAEREGADAVSVITTYFATPNQSELLSFYTDVAASTALPIILYNHPLRTSVNIAGATLGKLSQIPNIVGVKDSSANMNNTMSYLANMAPGFSALSGNDSLIVSLLDLGGAGTVSASANFVPGLVTALYRAYMAGEREKAIDLQMKLFAVRDVFSLGTYPAMIKDACRVMGIDMGTCRKPLASLGAEDMKKLEAALKTAGQL
ncbi:MAG: 4-hydroxy-tetrahydrodipicolinate synthase [Oscillospiraceae bacterium]|jgi:4-hydroxy-tetrahydrodipicolinate synthase|nr:4-hydroxy-tetrahydrodipicolinate synthase [Oscillospiraceae bacterium]